MFFKRIFNEDTTVVLGMEILSAPKRQKFPRKTIEKGAAEGWLDLSKGRVVIRCLKKDRKERRAVTDDERYVLVYKIDRVPGHYCCSCGKHLGGEKEARDHVAAMHKGPSPDPQNLAGYERINYYDCTKEA